MIFNSFSFLIFFPIVTLVFYIIPRKVRHVWLLAASYFFYMQWNVGYGLLLLYSTVVAYVGAILFEKAGALRARKAILVVCLVLGFVPLVYYKYMAFLIGNINTLLRLGGIYSPLKVPDILLPVGISFFTFQAVGYLIDVYRGEMHAERDFLRFALFVSFFPQLVAGPIERSKNLLSQLYFDHDYIDIPSDNKITSHIEKKADPAEMSNDENNADWGVSKANNLVLPRDSGFDFARARDGFWIMLWGYAMKVVIADRLAIFVDAVYGDYDSYGGVYLIIATVFFAFQIYCDFAGYSTIAMGAAQILGIRLMENFDSPYLACSVTEFWRRWHISLTSWFKDYLYIPLGGNRKGKLRKYLNKLFVFAVSGLWHGADWTYVIWGGLNGVFQVAEEMLRPLVKRLGIREQVKPSMPSRMARTIFTFILVDFTWIFFRAQSFDDAVSVIGSIFHTSNWRVLVDGSLYECGLDAWNFGLLIMMIIVLLIVDICGRRGLKLRKTLIEGRPLLQRSLVTALAITFILVFGIWGGMYDAMNFIYFAF